MTRFPIRPGALPVLVLSAALQAAGQEPVEAPASRPVEPEAPMPEKVAAAVERGADLLVALQENYVVERRPPPMKKEELPAWKAAESARRRKLAAARGEPREWPYEGVYRVRSPRGPAIPPGYRVGGTAIGCWALLAGPDLDAHPARRAAFDRGLAFVLAELESNPRLDGRSHGGYDVRCWGQAYGLMLLARVLARHAVEEAGAVRLRGVAQKVVRNLQALEIPERGGWNYSRRGTPMPSSFMTASALQALFAARDVGLRVDPAVVERGLAALESGRVPGSPAHQYGVDPEKRTGRGFESEAGSCARSAIVETTLLLAGRSSTERVAAAVKAFFRNWRHLEARRGRTGTHAPPYAIAPYYFHYGHTYAAQAVEMLPEEDRPAFRDHLRRLYWRTREEDGGWNDRVFPRSRAYGTAMAVLGLSMPRIGPPPRWE